MKGNGQTGVAKSQRRNGGHGPIARRVSGQSLNGTVDPWNGSDYVLITGGSGFVGANLAHRLLKDGERVLLYDNLSRNGVGQNFEWLQAAYGESVRLIKADTRDETAISAAVAHARAVFHFAAQVAVTTSLRCPLEDFAINAGGTLNLLEALRSRSNPPPLFFTSTNKVYGPIEDVILHLRGQRYEPVDETIRSRGISERQPLDFYSPYGCSKGAADQYIVDYSRTYGIPAVVFRMSCIYGPRQFGTEDQGWVAHFLIRALEDEPITMYGDGHQVRDILHVDNLVGAFLLARRHILELSGSVFNIGGGPANTISLLELIECIGSLEGKRPKIQWQDWRLGDQRFYVSDTTKFGNVTGWRAEIGVEEGVRHLHSWLTTTRVKRSFASVG